MGTMISDVRLMRDEDRIAVESTYAKVFDQKALDAWRRRFEWQFKANPATKYRPSKFWVGVSGETVLGFLASFPARLNILNTEQSVLCPCDLMVSPEARGMGLGERLIRAYIDEAGGMAIALAYSPTSGRLFNRLGYRSVYAEPSLIRPLRGDRMLRSLVKRRFAGASLRSRLIRFCAPSLTVGARGVIGLVNSVRSPRTSGQLRVETDPVFDKDFDRLWHVTSKEIPVAFSRDALTLQWRFRDDPITHHRVFAARESSGELAGYAVVCESKQHNLRVGKIMDLFCPPSRAKEVVGTLAASFLEHFHNNSFDLATTKGLHPTIRHELHGLMYLKAPGRETPAQFLWTRDNSLADTIYDADNWHLSHADGDEDFLP